MRRYHGAIQLTARQLRLLSEILDSFEEGRAMHDSPENSPAYATHDRLVQVLYAKISMAEKYIERQRKTDLRLAAVRAALRARGGVV